jgi:peroxiredoxin
MMRKIRTMAVIFLTVFILCIAGSSTFSGTDSPPAADLKPAPDVKMKDLDGNKFKLSDHRGNVVILNFWAVWCPPCKVEVPELVKLYNSYKDRGLRIIGVAIDSGKDQKIKEKAQELGINYPVVNGEDSAIRNSFGPIRAVPTTYVINKEGKVYRNYVGFRDIKIFEEDVTTLLGQ